MKHSTSYLYDCNPADFAELPYKEALQFKLDKANKLIYTLMEPNFMDRDDVRTKAVFAAAKFCKGLLDELK
jgi:hypothetical protein